MGVVHKLRDDVRDFILEQKKSLPAISCRKLSDVVQEKFGIIVSKSSISAVLKSANLNSPIGRHSLSVDEEDIIPQKPVKKFKIPEQKKSQIFLPQQAPLTPPPKIVIKPAVKKPLLSKADDKKILQPVDQKEAVSMRPLEMSNLKDKPIEPREINTPEQKGILIQNAGAIFLKAVEWNLAGGSLLGKILKDELGDRFNIDYEKFGDLLLLENPSNNEGKAKFDTSAWDWLWDPETPASDDQAKFASVLKSADDIADLGIKLSIELEVALQGASYFKFLHRDGTVIYFNAKDRGIAFDNVQSAGEIPFVQALRILNEEMIRNVQSAVFYCPPGLSSVEALLHWFSSVFSRSLSEAVKEISIINGQNIELVKQNYFPKKARKYVFVLTSWEKFFPAHSQSFGTGEAVQKMSVCQKTFYTKKFPPFLISSQDKNIPAEPLQAIAVSPSPTGKPSVVLMTNHPGDPENLKKAVGDFLLSWPDLGDDLDPQVLEAPAAKTLLGRTQQALSRLEETSTLAGCASAYRGFMKTLAQEHFFGSEDPAANLEKSYVLPGKLISEQRSQALTLILPSADPLLAPLRSAISRFNQENQTDIQGRRLILAINPG